MKRTTPTGKRCGRVENKILAAPLSLNEEEGK
jgi:hypothetical protein